MGSGWVGTTGCGLITTSKDGSEVPSVLVTVKLYVPSDSSSMIVLVPDPSIPPGLIIQSPSGKSFNTTLPVDSVQVGWVIVPTVGGAGTSAFILNAQSKRRNRKE